MPAVLQKLMRYSAIKITLRYCADDLAADLWREYAPVGMAYRMRPLSRWGINTQQGSDILLSLAKHKVDLVV